MFASAKKYKEKYSATMSSYMEVKRNVANDHDWKWALPDCEVAEGIIEQLHRQRDRSDFWKAWFYMETGVLRKEFSDAAASEIKALGDISELVDKFEKVMRPGVADRSPLSNRGRQAPGKT